jgi:hypothetical protein
MNRCAGDEQRAESSEKFGNVMAGMENPLGDNGEVPAAKARWPRVFAMRAISGRSVRFLSRGSGLSVSGPSKRYDRRTKDPACPEIE